MTHARDWNRSVRLVAASAVALVALTVAACGNGSAESEPPAAPTPGPAAASPATPPPATPTPTPEATGTIYVVTSGDTGWDIATRFGITLAELAEANEMSETDLNTLSIGQELRIPN